MSKTAAESWSSLAFYNLHRPKWTKQELPTSRMDRTLNKLGHNHELASTSTCQHFNKLINHQPEDTQINSSALANHRQFWKLAKPRTPKIDQTRKFYSRSALELMFFTLLLAMLCLQIAMSRMNLIFVERGMAYPHFNRFFSKSLAKSKFRANNANSSWKCLVHCTYKP